MSFAVGSVRRFERLSISFAFASIRLCGGFRQSLYDWFDPSFSTVFDGFLCLIRSVVFNGLR